ncbi:MAG: hypothetical protein ABIQ95_05935 [Bdellovibrionia bacterium]
MVKNKTHSVATLGVLGLICGMEGCGPLRPMSLPIKEGSPIKGELSKSETSEGNSGSDLSLGKSLSVNVALSNVECDSKSVGRELSLLNESVTVNEKQIVFGLSFPNRGCGLYLVWPRDFLGSAIFSGSVTYRIWNATNRWTPDWITVPIRFNSIKNLWFVSVHDLLRQRTSGIPPDPSSETHVLILELGLADQRNKVIEIRFRVQA